MKWIFHHTITDRVFITLESIETLRKKFNRLYWGLTIFYIGLTLLFAPFSVTADTKVHPAGNSTQSAFLGQVLTHSIHKIHSVPFFRFLELSVISTFIGQTFLHFPHAVSYTHLSLVGGGIYPNMLCAHPPFQIDGNFGFAAAVLEMLVQYEEQKIVFLPALPDEDVYKRQV